jgi:hypothetical protein
MRRRAFSDISVLLNDLIDRLEANPASTRLLAYVDEDGFGSVLERDRFERQLEQLAQSGGIQIQRRRINGDLVIAHVRLAESAVLYDQLGRQPSRRRAADALSSLRTGGGLPEGSQALFDEIERAWARGVSRFGLSPGDAASLGQAMDLLLTLVDRASDPAARSTDFRSFSRAAGVDSKALERLSGTVTTILGRLCPNLVPRTGLDADDLLATFGISKTPQPLLVSARLSVAGARLPDFAYYGFSAEDAAQVQLTASVDYVLMIENYVSFVRHVREVNADRSALIIYTGGFPARTHLREIVRLTKAAGSAAFHWGDMDAGGLRIFRHLEDALALQGVRLRPHLMEPSVLRQRGTASKNQRRLTAGTCAESAIAELWEAVAEHGLSYEQESLAPVRPLLESQKMESI